MNKAQKRLRRSMWIYYCIIGLCVAMIVLSAIVLIKYDAEYREGDNTYVSLKAQFVEAEDPNESPSQTYNLYANAVRYHINFDRLKNVNSDLTAWLISEGTKISYPIAYGTDNSYYLNHLFDGTKSKFGTLFIDYQNSPNFADQNTVIYGHRMKNGSMFASLLNYKSQEYYEQHPCMYLFYP